jgi:hypothetical protein
MILSSAPDPASQVTCTVSFHDEISQNVVKPPPVSPAPDPASQVKVRITQFISIPGRG